MNSSIFQAVHVYPNPATDLVIMENLLQEINWELFNYTGSTLLSGQSAGVIEKFNVSHLNPGIYILKITTTNGLSGRSFILSKE